MLLLLALASVVFLPACASAQSAPTEQDYCEGLDLVEASKRCTESNCLCRIQSARSKVGTEDYTSIEEGCFRQLSCPDSESTLKVNEPIKCKLTAQSDSGAFRFDGDGNNVSHESSNDDGNGAVLTFSAGLSAGEEVGVQYEAVGEENLRMGLGIGCDGYIYLLGAKGNGCELDQDGKCASSCPGCAFCEYGQEIDGYPLGVIWAMAAFTKVSDFIDGTFVLSGVVYYEFADDVTCSSGSDYLYCSGSSSEKEVSAECTVESKFNEVTTTGGEDVSSGGTALFALWGIPILMTTMAASL